MSGGITDFGATSWLAALLGITSLPSSYYIALISEEPGIDSDGDTIAAAEPDSAAGYARTSYATGASNWDVDGQYVFTLLDIDFGGPTGDWGTLPYYALCTAAVSGDLYAWGRFDNPIYAPANSGVLIPAGGIVLALASLDVTIAL